GVDISGITDACAQNNASAHCVAGVTTAVAAGTGAVLMSLVPLLLSLVAASGLRAGRRAAWFLAIGVNAVMALLTGASAGTAQIAAPRGPRGGAPVGAENGVQLDRHCAGHGEFSRPAGHWPADRPRGAAAGA
ncbi:MAG TPA: hypothetical protein PLF19_00410, partial [Ottowia sp.]|nr:hypothetical protein [Ottowia sp.]